MHHHDDFVDFAAAKIVINSDITKLSYRKSYYSRFFKISVVI